MEVPQRRDWRVAVDRETDTLAQRGRTCIHAGSPLRTNRGVAVLITPVVDVIAEDIGAHTHGSHALVLRLRRELAVLNGVAMVPTRMTLKRCFDSVDEDLGCLVTVAVTVHGDASSMVVANDVGQLLGCHQPQTVAGVTLGSVVIVGPAHTSGEALDRTIEHQLDDPELELVGGLSLQIIDNTRQVSRLLGSAEHRRPCHHDASGIRRIIGHLAPGIERVGIVDSGCAEISEQRVAGITSFVGVVPLGLVRHDGHGDLGHTGPSQHHCRWLLQLTIWCAIGVASNTWRD